MEGILRKHYYSYPGSDYILQKSEDFWLQRELNVLFPILHQIPILLEQNKILASSYLKFIK